MTIKNPLFSTENSHRSQASVSSLFSKAHRWYQNHLQNLEYPIYSSYDIRESGEKRVVVDANIYPAGFNNILKQDHPFLVQALHEYLEKHFESSQRVLLVTEEHTLNPFYWDNIAVLKYCLEQTGRQVLVALPWEEAKPSVLMKSFSHGLITAVSGSFQNPEVQKFAPDIIISNNDFSQDLALWAHSWDLPMTPPREMGWYQRQKSSYFKIYNELASELAHTLDLDPFWLRVETELFDSFNIDDSQSQKKLAYKVDEFLEKIAQQYSYHHITHKPTVFIKNNAGTYGLGVTQVQSGQEILTWSYRQRKKMKAVKGGGKIRQLILQEGVPTQTRYQGFSAESVVYMGGCKPVGHFLRYHPKKQKRNL
jgi:glutamate--cysteine ligase